LIGFYACYIGNKIQGVPLVRNATFIIQDKEEESAIISFRVIGHVKMELANNVLETVSISGIGVLCDERQSRTTSSQPNCALRIPRFGC